MIDREILIQGYWLEFAKKLVALEKTNDYNAENLKKAFLEGIEILDKIIELEEKA